MMQGCEHSKSRLDAQSTRQPAHLAQSNHKYTHSPQHTN